jgi:hypothetical protein
MFKQAKDHLSETKWTYWQHLRHSIKQSNRLIVIAVKSYIHGVFPWAYKTDGPLSVYKIYKEIRNLHHVQRMFSEHDKKE